MNREIHSCPAPSGTGRLIMALSGLAAISPFATDMYTPGFPQIVASLETSPATVQLSLTSCLLGIAIGQVIIGPISDLVGRRRLIIIGSALFAAFSLLCALAPSASLLNIARLLQGFAGGTGIVLGRAVISDQFADRNATKQIATLSVISMTAPILAPIVGGLVLNVFSWRTVFFILTGAGVLLTITVWAWVPETLLPDMRKSRSLGYALSAMLRQLRRRAMVGYLLTLGCAVGALFAYISSAPFLFQGIFELSAGSYSLIFASNAVGTIVASLIVRRLADRARLTSMLGVGAGIGTVSMLALVLAFSSGVVSLPLTWLLMFGLTFGFGLVLPTSTSLILALGRNAPGAASGLLGGFQFLIGAIAAPISGLLGEPTPLRAVAVILGFLLLSVISLIALARPWRTDGVAHEPDC